VLLSGYHYNAKFTLLVFQLILSIAFCAFAKRFLRGVPGLEVPDVTMDNLRKAALPGAMSVANIVIGWSVLT